MSAPPPLRPLPLKALSMIVGRIRQVLKWLPDLLGVGGGGRGGGGRGGGVNKAALAAEHALSKLFLKIRNFPNGTQQKNTFYYI